MGYLTKMFFGLAFMALAGLAGLSKGAHAQDCEDKFNSLTDQQRSTFNIAIAEWKPATATLPPHAFMVGCHGCAGATYGPTGLLLDPLDLNKIPTSWIMLAPKNCNGRGVVIVPPATADQVQALTLFSQTISALMNEGYTIATMNHPTPGYPGFPFDTFIEPPFQVHDLRNAYFGTGHLLRNLTTEVFGDPVGIYALSLSRGTISGMGLLADEEGSPFDGYAIGTGGNGSLPQLQSFLDAYQTNPNRISLTGIPPLQITKADKVARLTGIFAAIDPDYYEFVLSGANDDEQLARALAYNLAARPAKVQRAWDDVEFGAELKKPTIVLHGLRDRQVPPEGPIAFGERVVDAGKSDLYRLYLVKDMAHGPADPPVVPQGLSADAVRKLDAWVQNGVEPGSLNASQFGLRPSCATLGYGEDPLGCFCEVLADGIGGFCSDDSNVACMTNNPTTPANEDHCFIAGKGTCVTVIPPECGG